jgi:hypothetical protein
MSGTLNHSPADVLKHLLIQLGLGVLHSTSPTGSWPIFDSSEPSLPDQVVTIYDTAGRYDGRSMRDGEKAEFHGVQVRIRGVNQPDALIKANDIAVSLDQSINRSKVTIDGDKYMVYAVSRTSGPVSLGNEVGTNRFLFTINAVVSLRLYT